MLIHQFGMPGGCNIPVNIKEMCVTFFSITIIYRGARGEFDLQWNKTFLMQIKMQFSYLYLKDDAPVNILRMNIRGQFFQPIFVLIGLQAVLKSYFMR